MGSLLPHTHTGSWCAHSFVCTLQEWSLCFPQSCQSPAIKSRSPSKSDSLGIPLPVARPPGWEAWSEAQNIPVGGLLWNNCSPVCESPTQWLWDLILLWLCPSYCLIVSSPLSLDVGVYFLVSSSVFLSMIVQQLAVIPVLLQVGVSACPSTLPSWTEGPKSKILKHHSRPLLQKCNANTTAIFLA